MAAAVLTPSSYKKKPKKPAPPKMGAFKDAHGATWKADLYAAKMAQKSANAALKKTKKGTPEYAAAKAAFDAAYLAVPHAAHKSSGFSKFVKKASGVFMPIMPTMHGIQLTSGAKGILGKDFSALANKALKAGGKIALAGAAADITSGFNSITGQGGLGPGGGGLQVLPESDDGMGLFGSGGTLDDIFGGLSKAGQYAQSAGEALAQFKGAFGTQGGSGGGGGGGGASADYGPVAPSAPAEPSAMQRYLPWILLGGGALVLVLVMRKGR